MSAAAAAAAADAVCDALVKLTCVVRYITPEVDAGRAHPSVATLQLVRAHGSVIGRVLPCPH